VASETPREIPGGKADGGYYSDTAYYLTWSPDSQDLVFPAEHELRRVSVSQGGSATTICTLPDGRSSGRPVAGIAWSDDGAVFRLINGEPHAILLWNVRVQVRSTDRGTDGFGWDTVDDDYPMGTVRYNSAHYPPGSTGEFRVHQPGKTPWRVCVLYSTDWTDSAKGYSGNYEVISEELKE
jgi:hypothetical protein